MQKMLGRAAAVAAGALMIVGLGASTASAHVAVGGEGGGVVTAHHPFAAGWGEGFACAGHVHTKGEHAFWATDEATGGEGGDEVSIDGWHHHG